MNGLVLQVAAQCCEGKENTTCILKSFYINSFWFMYLLPEKLAINWVQHYLTIQQFFLEKKKLYNNFWVRNEKK